MVNLKNYSFVLKTFVLLLTLSFFLSCNSSKNYVTKIEGKKLSITENQKEDAIIDNYIKPYRDKIDSDLNQELAYNPETLEKSKGEWQTNIGDFLADITLQYSNKVFQKREKKSIDICVLNHGGIRSILPKGMMTARNAYEVMPFENSAIVLELQGKYIEELANFIISEKKPHPIMGFTFSIDSKTNKANNIKVNGATLDLDKKYYLVTSDYLSNGGDNMTFLNNATQKFDIEYKLRNIMIDYFKDVETVNYDKSVKIFKN
jgi:2',3'-cyclic-nucleotide 2'-phosphodiesterase (5'-nucleotidase family)